MEIELEPCILRGEVAMAAGVVHEARMNRESIGMMEYEEIYLERARG